MPSSQHTPSIAPYIQRKATTGNAYQAANVIAAIHQAGGLAVLAHPARYKRSRLRVNQPRGAIRHRRR